MEYEGANYSCVELQYTLIIWRLPCKLHGINPHAYLVDVLQRVQIHPNSDIAQLTPRLWKQHFADDPIKSDIELDTRYVV